MEIFVRVVESGSFSRAATALSISRARATEAVQNLEQALGARLLHRTTRQVTLTDDGRIYYTRAIQILADLEDAENSVGVASKVVRGLLRADLPLAMARIFVLPKLPVFLKQHPRLELQIRLENSSAQLLQDGADCAVCYGVPSALDYVVRPLAETRLVTCAAPGYLRKNKRISKPLDVNKHNCIGFIDGAGRPAPWQFANFPDYATHVPSGSVAFNSMEACVEAASGGFGVTQVLSAVAQNAILEGRLVPVLMQYVALGPGLHFAYAPSRRASLRLRVFADFIKGAFAEIDAGWTALSAKASSD